MNKENSNTAREKKRVDAFIPNERMGEFNRKIERLQATAKKLGLPEWEVTIGSREWRPVTIYREDGYGGIVGQSMQLEGQAVSIEGAAPVIGGWRFLAKIEHGEDGNNLIKGMAGGDAWPKEWHQCAPDCDHCRAKRGRTATFMLQQVESGDIKQVGSSCVEDFIGQLARDPERIAGMYEYLMRIGEEFELDDDRFTGSVSAPLCVEPERLMAAALKIVEKDSGYISAEKAEALVISSTVDQVRAAFWSRHKSDAVTPDAGHLELAPKIVEWLQGQKEADSSWLRNIGYLAGRAGIGVKDAGLFASGLIAYQRAMSRESRAERGAGEWIGTSGEKVSVRATLERRAGFDTSFGFRSVLTFRDEMGNALVWKTQSAPAGLVTGSSYRLLATVKEHAEYRGEKQTEILRAKVAELELFNFGTLSTFAKMAALASPDIMDKSGYTPLVKAVWGDHVAHAKALIEAGANPNQRICGGEYPILAHAATSAMAQLLLDAGARAVDLEQNQVEALPADVRQLVAQSQAATVGDAASFHGFQNTTVGQPPPAGVRVVTEGVFHGKVDAVTDAYVIQSIGRGQQVAHVRSLFETAPPKTGTVMEVSYRDGRIAMAACISHSQADMER